MWGNDTTHTLTPNVRGNYNMFKQGDFYFSQNENTMNFYFKITGRSRLEAELVYSIDTHTHFLAQMCYK